MINCTVPDNLAYSVLSTEQYSLVAYYAAATCVQDSTAVYLEKGHVDRGDIDR